MTGPHRRLAIAWLAIAVVLSGCARVPPPPLPRAPQGTAATVPGTQATSGAPAAPSPTGPTPNAAPTATQGTPGEATKTPVDPDPSQPPTATGSEPPQQRRVNCRKRKCVALTFDDGPVAQTAHVLDVLAAHDAHATFFVLGSLARQHPHLLRRMVAEGHAIGNHSWSHPQFWDLTSAQIRSQVKRTSAVIRQATGQAPTMLRPPYGESSPRVRAIARRFGLAIVLWSLDPLDWKYRDTDRVVSRITRGARPGAIVLSHDTRPTTRRAVARVVERLQAKGFVLVTVPELFGGRLRPGLSYSQR